FCAGLRSTATTVPVPAASRERAVHPPELTTTTVSCAPASSASISRTGSSRTCAKYNLSTLAPERAVRLHAVRHFVTQTIVRPPTIIGMSTDLGTCRYAYSGPSSSGADTFSADGEITAQPLIIAHGETLMHLAREAVVRSQGGYVDGFSFALGGR